MMKIIFNQKRWATLMSLIFLATATFAQGETKYQPNLDYYSDFCIVVQVKLNNEVIPCEVAAFCADDDECRGANLSTPNEKYGDCVYLKPSGDNNSMLYFRVVFTLDGVEYDVKAKEEQQFICGGVLGSAWEPFVIELSSMDLILTQGYRTFYDSANNYVIPEGVNGYTYTVENDKLVCNKSYPSGSVLPKGTAVVLYDNTGANHITLVATQDKGSALETASSLCGTDDDTLIQAEDGERHYILGVGSKGVGLYIAYNLNLETPSFTNLAHKAYLYLSPSETMTRPAMFTLGIDTDGKVVGIREVECNEYSDGTPQIFNIMGMPVGHDYKGLIITNGKKMLKGGL